MTYRHPSIIEKPKVSIHCSDCNHIVYVGSLCNKTHNVHRRNRAFEAHDDVPSKTVRGHVWD